MLSGCGDSPPTRSGDSTVANETQSSPVATSPVDSGVTLPATSAEALVAAYKTAFEAGDVDAIEKMVHWGDEPYKESTMTIVFNVRIARKGTAKIPTIKVRDLTEGGFDPSDFTLPPTKTVSGHYSYDGGGGDLGMPIGELDGHFYFCVVKSKS